MDDANLVFLLIHAAKTSNRKLFHKCNGEMANLFFAFDGQNYSRYLTLISFFHFMKIFSNNVHYFTQLERSMESAKLQAIALVIHDRRYIFHLFVPLTWHK